MCAASSISQSDGAATMVQRRDGGIGRRSGLKIRRGQPRGGSTPPPGTTLAYSEYERNHLSLSVREACSCLNSAVRFVPDP